MIDRLHRKHHHQSVSKFKSKELKTSLYRNQGSMSFWIGTFRTPCNELQAKDTFLDLPGWRKGVAFLNGINLGR
jgi:hypothetical protein